jgi:non-ribosomal peptide synthetase component E (peptide arylation enzyme)
MSQLETASDKVPLSAAYVAEGTYPADICVLRYALERNARTKPDDIFAAFEGGERWTFAQTLQQVESFAGNLNELGVRQGDHVVLVLPTSPLALRAMFAINYLGAVYVPVNPALKGSSLELPAPRLPSFMTACSIVSVPRHPLPSRQLSVPRTQPSRLHRAMRRSNRFPR